MRYMQCFVRGLFWALTAVAAITLALARSRRLDAEQASPCPSV